MFHSAFVAAIFFAVSSIQVQAQTNTTIAVPAATSPAGTVQSSTGASFFDHLHLGLFSNMHGPNTTHFASGNAIGANGLENRRQPMYFDSELSVDYLLGSSYGVGVVIPFWYMPVQGHEMSLGDVGVKFFEKKIIQTPELKLGTNLILQLPTNEFTKLNGIDLGVKLTPHFRYNFKASRFSIGAFTEAKAYVGAEKGKLFKLYGSPFVSYQLSPNVLANLAFEYEAHHLVNTSWLDFRTIQYDLMPGMVFHISPKLMVNPYFQIMMTEKVAMDRTAVGAIIVASI